MSASVQGCTQNYVALHLPSPRRSAWLAGLMSLFVPGLGHLYKGHVVWALIWFLVTPIGYAFFLLPGLFLHVLCVLFAITVSAK